MSVNLFPLAAWSRKTQYKPQHPPVFSEDSVAREDVELALALFDVLDPESQAWYGGNAFVARLTERLQDLSGSDSHERA